MKSSISSAIFNAGLAILVACNLCSELVGQIHAWDKIDYPALECDFGSGTALPQLGVAGKGLRFRLSFSWAETDLEKKGFAVPDESRIAVRLHYRDGTIVAADESSFDGELSRISSVDRSWAGSFECVFPWGKNEMEECWLELVFPERAYWLEIPYGFTRDPNSPDLPVAKAGSPKLPKVLETLPENAKIGNWQHVSYDIGVIQNGWRLSLKHSNPFDAHSEIVLYRDDIAVGKSMFLWDLQSPRTEIRIRDSTGFELSEPCYELAATRWWHAQE